MGYTRYWERTTEPITEDFIEAVREVLDDCKSRGIIICDWDGCGEPTLTTERISFNGCRYKNCDLSHESFVLNSNTGFDFCKTARKPYDYAVRRVLRLAKEYGLVINVGSDGAERHIYSDERYMKEHF